MTAFRPGPPEQHPKNGPPPGRPPQGTGPGQYGHDRGHEHDPNAWRAHMREVIAHAGALEAGQTNAFYYVVWQQDGSLLANSPGAPKDVPMPAETGHGHESGDRPGANTRTRGEFREFCLCFP